MKKRYIALGVSLGATASYLLVSENARKNISKTFHSIMNQIRGKETGTLLDKAGIPDQLANEELEALENAKMVSEGSQYGVQYYNEVREEDE